MTAGASSSSTGPSRKRRRNGGDEEQSMGQQQGQPSGQQQGQQQRQQQEQQQEPSGSGQQPVANNAPNPQQPQDQNRIDYSYYTLCGNDRYTCYHVPRLGYGSYGNVLSAYDNHEMIDVAVKVFDTTGVDFMGKFNREIDNLRKIGGGHANIVEYKTCFTSDGNFPCVVFELLGKDMYEVLNERGQSDELAKGFDLNECRNIGMQIVNALMFLDDIGIVHSDLNPNNIVFTRRRRDDIRLIDFGHSFDKNSEIIHEIQTLNYRAPEVFLGNQPYTNTIDIWSFGCLLITMHTAAHCFFVDRETSNYEMMDSIMQVCGIPPHNMIHGATYCDEYFVHVDGRYIDRNRTVERNRKSLSDRLEINRAGGGGPHGMYIQKQRHGVQDYRDFESLINLIFVYEDRCTLDEISRHDFFQRQEAPPPVPERH